MIKVHGNSVEINGKGILLTGPSGSGKSDLTLRLIDGGARLISDDYTEISSESGQAIMSPPVEIAGRLEIRGVGLMKLSHCRDIPLHLVFDLKNRTEIERMPEHLSMSFDGVTVPVRQIDPFTASAAAIVRHMASTEDIRTGYETDGG
ncbi:MAG: HPr kinase/phosphatase C-terminal domain-containing protein [Proteobacteria bacterium]|nr:HPr kinase/phosphatase C-terminal domain-containing protein [Pseudomonadota bacterium]